ncbi:MAG TPA: ornithine carbamoyltransferase, partial [Anaerolineae bacterium]|nr:ornithine carbamoyltransferase [Anaerolineae bacterium]
DLSSEEFMDLLHLAESLKGEWQQEGRNRPLLVGRTLGMLFQKPSLRTRVSFEMGMIHLGGHALYLSPNEVGLGGRESVADVARVLSRYVDGIMARVFDHAHIQELAAYSRVPVINGLSDYNHPCQALSDLFTIYEKRGRLRGLRLAFVGDGNNVAVSLAFACAKVGMDFVQASPPGYELPVDVVQRAQAIAEQQGSKIDITHDVRAAVAGVDVIYTDVWTSMGQEAEREERLRVFPPYQVNRELVAASGRDDVMVMHCLPAHRGEEITDEVADGPHSVLFEQAENRMHAQKAILVRLLA